MRKLLLTLILSAITSSLFATRIGISYKDIDYVLNTSTSISETDTPYFEGMYDALVCVKEGRQLYEIQQVISKKTYINSSGVPETEKKNQYIAAFKDFMRNYSSGSMGSFDDIYPIYDALMAENTMSYRNAMLVTEFGKARFYIRNL